MPQQSKDPLFVGSSCISFVIPVFWAGRGIHAMILRAYAKINLGLHILGKRSDGYHSIETVFRLINLYDEIEIVQNDQGIHFTTDSPELMSDRLNLCVRAAHVLRDLTGIHTGVEISLKKHIPIGAGLGGGSSDAAAVLQGLTRLWALDISRDELQTVGATLGSDVPFFFNGMTAYATGRGEILEPFDLSIPYAILLVTPKIHVSTGWAYSQLRLSGGTTRHNVRKILEDRIGEAERLEGVLVNDFEQPVFDHFPEIAGLKKTILSGGASFALMSGSGSSVFGLFRDPVRANVVASSLSGNYRTSVTEPSFKPLIN